MEEKKQPIHWLIDIWNKHRGRLSPIESCPQSLGYRISKALGKHPNREFWEESAKNLNAPFLQGQVFPRNGLRPFRATFDWWIDVSRGNALKTKNGEYGDYGGRGEKKVVLPYQHDRTYEPNPASERVDIEPGSLTRLTGG